MIYAVLRKNNVAEDEENHACFWDQTGSHKDVSVSQGIKEKKDA